jgi:hypothetical protein
MSNVLIVVNSRNPDMNNLSDLAAAVADAGGTVVEIDEPNGVIEANVPTELLPVVAAMEGISYVRSVFSYFCSDPIKAA